MKQIRKGIFETNSSSTHSMTMCSGEEFDAWVNGDTLYADGDFCSHKEAVAEMRKELAKYDKIITDEDYQKWLNKNYDGDETSALIDEGGYRTYSQWCDTEYDLFEDEYTTKSGERVVAFGEYG